LFFSGSAFRAGHAIGINNDQRFHVGGKVVKVIRADKAFAPSKIEEVPMSIRRVNSPHVPEPPPERWSNCLVADGIAYVSGMTARGIEPETLARMDEYEQAKIAFGKIKGMVEAAGGTMADVVKVTIYVTSIKNNTKVWAARREFFTGDFPASTLVEVSALATPEILVEIEAIAHIGKGARR